MAGAVAPLILMIKKEILTLKTQKNVFVIKIDHLENNSKVVLNKYPER